MYYLKSTTGKTHTITFSSISEVSEFLAIPQKIIEHASRSRSTLKGFKIWNDTREKNITILAIEDDKSYTLTMDEACDRYLLSEEKLKELLDTGKATHDGVTFDILFDELSVGRQRNKHGCWQKTLTIDGETHFIEEWGKIANIKPDTIRCRLRHKKSPKDAVFAPVRNPLEKKK